MVSASGPSRPHSFRQPRGRLAVVTYQYRNEPGRVGPQAGTNTKTWHGIHAMALTTRTAPRLTRNTCSTEDVFNGELGTFFGKEHLHVLETAASVKTPLRTEGYPRSSEIASARRVNLNAWKTLESLSEMPTYRLALSNCDCIIGEWKAESMY